MSRRKANPRTKGENVKPKYPPGWPESFAILNRLCGLACFTTEEPDKIINLLMDENPPGMFLPESIDDIYLIIDRVRTNPAEVLESQRLIMALVERGYLE